VEIIQICLNPTCLHGYTQAGRTHCHYCASAVRYLAEPIDAGVFAEMDNEQRADLKLAPKAKVVT
jgi:hypothetical protein